MSHRNSFSRQYRIRKRWEFRSVQQTGRKIVCKHFIVLFQIRDQGPPRLGITVSRKVGSAVQRNRVKRLLREFFRRNREKFPAQADFVIIARRGAHELSCLSVYRELESLFGLSSLPESASCPLD